VSMLLIDVGNTRVKWARWDGKRLSAQRAAAHAGWSAQDFAKQVIRSARGIDRIVVASVAGDGVRKKLIAAARNVGAVVPEFVQTTRHAAGIGVAYAEPWRLGVDRFVAIIGAHALFPTVPVCIVDVGTAMTIDLVDGIGRHRGGAIIPGPELMVQSLLKNTDGIRKRARGGREGHRLFANNTLAAIERGAGYAAAAVVDRAVEEARAEIGAEYVLVLTGGAASIVQPLIRSAYVVVPDLVLRGLVAHAEESAALRLI